MRFAVAVAVSALICGVAHAVHFTFEQRDDGMALLGDGKAWITTLPGAYAPLRRGETYKVFTHVYDFEGTAPITKGAGGKYTHHRGLFIGWKDTTVSGMDFDTWHMAKCHQEHAEWLATEAGTDSAIQRERIRWINHKQEPFIDETRAITVAAGPNGRRVIDFASTLTSLAGTINLRGDLQHAGMQMRMANEVDGHPQSTDYILPKGAKALDDDKVVGGHWACCSPVVRGKRYWIVHMTPQDLPVGEPVYSIRPYARFGAFVEADLEEGEPLPLRFRIVISDKKLDRGDCAALYDEYVQSGT